MDRTGYLKWRSDLYVFHAEAEIKIMAEAGFDQASMDRVKKALSKRGFNSELRFARGLAPYYRYQGKRHAAGVAFPQSCDAKCDVVGITRRLPILQARCGARIQAISYVSLAAIGGRPFPVSAGANSKAWGFAASNDGIFGHIPNIIAESNRKV